MPFLVLAGEYRIAGTAPDGDSVRFYPDDPALWASVGGLHAVRRNAAGGAQVRLDAVDALETHYTADKVVVHQPLGLAHAARDELLRWLGFTRVARDGSAETVSSSEPATVRGYLLTRSADKYGRCIAFAGRGDDLPAADGQATYLRASQLRRTANHRLLSTGLAYPTYYRALFPDLRATLDKAVHAARAARRGVWATDRTRSGFRVVSLDQVQAEAVIMPKLFRRLVAYLALGAGDASLAGFPGYLAALDDRLSVLPDGHWTGFDSVVDVDGQTVRIRPPIEHLIFDEG